MSRISKGRWSVGVWSGVAAWALGQTLVFLAAVTSGHAPFELSIYSQWDSGHYLAIAEHGPMISKCVDVANRTSEQWCGSAGWLPLYPLFISLFSKITSLSLASSAFIIASGCAAIISILLSRFVEVTSGSDPLQTFAIACNAAIFPGMVWGYVSFPVSMTLMFFWIALLLNVNGKWLSGSLIIGLTAVTHSIGIVVVGVWLIISLFQSDKQQWVLRLSLTLLPSGCLFAYQEVVLGHWNAHLLVQSAYGHQPGFLPFVVIRRFIYAMNQNSTPAVIVGLQQFWILIIIGLALIQLLRRSRQVSLTQIAPVIIGLTCLAFALSVNHGSDFAYWRAFAFGSVVVPAFTAIDRRYLWGMAATNALFFFAIANGFVRSSYF